MEPCFCPSAMADEICSPQRLSTPSRFSRSCGVSSDTSAMNLPTRQPSLHREKYSLRAAKCFLRRVKGGTVGLGRAPRSGGTLPHFGTNSSAPASLFLYRVWDEA